MQGGGGEGDDGAELWVGSDGILTVRMDRPYGGEAGKYARVPAKFLGDGVIK